MNAPAHEVINGVRKKDCAPMKYPMPRSRVISSPFNNRGMPKGIITTLSHSPHFHRGFGHVKPNRNPAKQNPMGTPRRSKYKDKYRNHSPHEIARPPKRTKPQITASTFA